MTVEIGNGTAGDVIGNGFYILPIYSVEVSDSTAGNVVDNFRCSGFKFLVIDAGEFSDGTAGYFVYVALP